MNWVSSWFNVLPLDEAILLLKKGLIPSKAACITFDDGYADNFTIALPILKKYKLTATFFVSTGFLDGGRMWNDTIIESLRSYSNNTLDLTPLGLEPMPLNNTVEKILAIEFLLKKIKHLNPDCRSKFTNLFSELTQSELPNNLMMTSDQVRGMRKAGMLIGAHTVTHPILAGTASKLAEYEISESKSFLENLLREKIELFAYPNGKPDSDYSPNHVALVKELGFKAAFSTTHGCASMDSDLFQIPRFTPWDKKKIWFGGRILRNLAFST